MSTPEGFDRLRRRGSGAGTSTGPAGAASARPDPQGRSALYSVSEQPPAPGAVTVTCSDCEQTTAVSPRRLATLALPSVHLPLLRRDHPSWMRCPACGKRTWVKVVITL
ncbi:MAG: hypothetical protein ABI807_06420 [Sporichthyaceae bacterium]